MTYSEALQRITEAVIFDSGPVILSAGCSILQAYPARDQSETLEELHQLARLVSTAPDITEPPVGLFSF